MKALKAFIKPFEAPQSVKVKSYVNFLSSFGIRTEKVKAGRENEGEQASDSVNPSFSLENWENVSVEHE